MVAYARSACIASFFACLMSACTGTGTDATPQVGSAARGTSTFGIIPVETEYALGCVACEGPAAITPIAMAAGPDGSTYIIDSFEPFVRGFSREGDILLAAGRKGQGPPDFKRPIGVYPLDDGTLWVHDGLPPGRLFELDEAGAIRQIIELGQPVLNLAAMHPSRHLFYTVAFERGVGSLVPESALARLVKWDLSRERAPERVFAVEETSGTESASQTSREYRRWSVAVSHNGDVAVGYIHDYLIKIVSVDGRLKTEIRRDLPVELDPRGRVKPYFPAGGLDFADDGRLWVQRFRGGNEGATTVFDVFETDYAYLGEVVMPRRVLEQQAKAFDVTGTEIVAVTLNEENGERFVTRWRLTVASPQ